MLDIGVVLPTVVPDDRPPQDPVGAAEAAEEGGLDSVWVGDHLATGSSVLEAVCVIAAVAARTSRIRLGFSVLIPALRDPIWMAKQVATLQHLSNDRIVLGVGVGGEYPAEFEAAGMSMATRGRDTDAALDALPTLLAGKTSNVLGRAVPPLLPPAPVPRTLIGGRSQAALQRVIERGDGWIGFLHAPASVRQLRDALHRLAKERGVPEPEIALVVPIHVSLPSAAAEVGDWRSSARAQLGIGGSGVERYCVAGDTEACAAGLGEYVQAGVETIVLLPLPTADWLEQVRRLCSVAARLRSA